MLTALGMVAGLAAIEGGIVLIAAFPDLALAGWFVLGWAAPRVIGEQAAGMLVGVMVLEFIIIHASIALVAAQQVIAQKAAEGVWWKSEKAVFAGLLLMYSVAAAGIRAGFHAAWLFIGFCELCGGFNRVPAATGLPGRSG